MTAKTVKRGMTWAAIAILAAWTAVGQDAEWDVDPYSWARDGEGFVSHGGFKATAGGVAVAKVPCRTTVKMRAEVTVTKPGDLLEGGVGIAIRDNFETHWSLMLKKAAKGAGGKRYAALNESMQRADGAQRDLRRVRTSADFAWKDGETYVLELELAPSGAKGRVSRPGTGETLYESEFAANGKPWVDRGRPSLYVYGDFTAKVGNVRFEGTGDVEPTRIPTVPYACENYIRGVTAKATGFFRCEKIDGRWTLIDPLGRGYMGLGIGLCSRGAGHCEALGYSEYARVNDKKFPKPGQWEEDTVGKLSDWGFTTFGNGVQRSLLRRGLSACLNLYIGRRLAMVDDEWAITTYKGCATTGFPNVFHPQFAAACDFLARDYCGYYRDDPWLLGYYLDNEPDMNGKDYPARKLALGLFDAAMARPKGHSARKAAEECLAGRKVTDEIRREFLAVVAERYFRTFAEAIRRHDPNHMIFGCRFPGMGSACDETWKAAAKHCDVLTFNVYPWVDLETGALTHGRGGRKFRPAYEELFAKCGKPFYVTEWSFNALDSGLPCLFGAGQVFQRQSQRARAAERFARELIASPCFVGYDYFSWLDQPALGWSATDPENSNFGLVNKDGVPYREMTEMFKRIHRDLARYRNEPMSEPKVTYARDGDEWRVENAAGLVLKGKVGGKMMVEDILLDGRRLGCYNGMATFDRDDNPSVVHWWDASAVRSVGYQEKDGYGVLAIVSDGTDGAWRKFRLVHQIVVAPFDRDFRVSVVGIANVGERAFGVDRLMLREYPDDSAATGVAGPRRNMDGWDRRDVAVWQLADGHRFGMEAMGSPNAIFRMNKGWGGKWSQDLSFLVPGFKRLEPGEKWRPVQPMNAKTILE